MIYFIEENLVLCNVTGVSPLESIYINIILPMCVDMYVY